MSRLTYGLQACAVGLICILALSAGCLRANPASPDLIDNIRDSSVPQSQNRSTLGYWQFSISADRQEVNATPVRTAEFHLNAVNLLENKSCTNCLSLSNNQVLPNDKYMVDVKLTHPYPGMNKFTGFDVRGILITGSDYTFPESGRTISWNGDHLKMICPDGYTALFNPTEFSADSPNIPVFKYTPGKLASGGNLTSTLNPFVYYGKSNERRMFGSGQADIVTIYLKLAPGPQQFGYAVDASWMPVDGEVTNPVEDFPVSANCQEVSQMFVSIGKGLTPTGTSSAKVMIEAFDWQGIDTVDKITIEAPDLFNGEVEATLSTVTDGGIGGVFEGMIQNSLHAPIGDYSLLVTATDISPDEHLGKISGYQIATAHVTLTGVWIRELILIPAGDFIMGSDPAVDPQATELSGELPQHIHPTGHYYIGKYEITCEEFAPFIADGGYTDPGYWSPEGWEYLTYMGKTKPNNWNEWPFTGTTNGITFPDYPVHNLTLFEAEAFCNWAGGRLPSEAEWEKAARGTDGRIYPWGNEWDPYKCNGLIGQHYAIEPVGSYSPEGDSPYGLCDASGNVMEWTNDWLNLKIYDQYAMGNFDPPAEPWPYPNFKPLRGGHWGTTFQDGQLRCADRHGMENNDSKGGFRIVFDP